jgi:hypothetical protein
MIYNPELTGKPCEDGKQFHTKIPEEMATNLLDMAVFVSINHECDTITNGGLAKPGTRLQTVIFRTA